MNWKRQIIESLLIFAGGGCYIFTWCSTCLDSFQVFAVAFSYNGLFYLLLWKGSEAMVVVSDKFYSWVDAPFKRLIAGVLAVVIYVAVIVYILDVAYDVFVRGKSFSEAASGLENTDLLSITLITLGINAFMHGRGFLLEWRQMSIDLEKIKTEQVSSQYESLKNQVNPHFLFNSLNALTSLVYDDQAKAVEFIRKLSQVYRYVLDKKDEELVPLQDEVDFMENFIFLQKIRFGENLEFTISKSVHGGYLPPLALQILVENAIKHNVVSEKNPLTIKIEISDELCAVSNSIKEKLAKDSTGIGLSNLTARYQYLTKRKVEILNNGKEFVVKLPILALNK